jgi:hypothetical protein
MNFFTKKTVVEESKPKILVESSDNSTFVVTPNEKMDTTISEIKNVILISDQDTPVLPVNAASGHYIVTAEKSELTSNDNSKNEVVLSQLTAASLPTSPTDYHPPARKESFSSCDGDSVVFSALEVDPSIERLVRGGSPSPLRTNSVGDSVMNSSSSGNNAFGSNNGIFPLKDEEISSFFVSSPSATNISVDYSVKIASLESCLPTKFSFPSAASLSSQVFLNAPSFAKIEQKPIETVDAFCSPLTKKEMLVPSLEDEPYFHFEPAGAVPIAEAKAVAEITSPDDGGNDVDAKLKKSSRKRKPVNAFDPTPPTRPKKAKPVTSKPTVINGSTHAGVSLSMQSPTVEGETNAAQIEPMDLSSEEPSINNALPTFDSTVVTDPLNVVPKTKTPRAKKPKNNAEGEPSLVSTASNVLIVKVVPQELIDLQDQVLGKMKILSDELVVHFES